MAYKTYSQNGRFLYTKKDNAHARVQLQPLMPQGAQQGFGVSDWEGIACQRDFRQLNKKNVLSSFSATALLPTICGPIHDPCFGWHSSVNDIHLLANLDRSGRNVGAQSAESISIEFGWLVGAQVNSPRLNNGYKIKTVSVCLLEKECADAARTTLLCSVEHPTR